MFDRELGAKDLWTKAFWVHDYSLEDSVSLSDPHVIAQEIADDVRSAPEQIEDIRGDLEKRVGAGRMEG